MPNGTQNQDTKSLYEKILDLSYRNNMTRAQIAVRLGLDVARIDRVLIYDRTHQDPDGPAEADLDRIFAA